MARLTVMAAQAEADEERSWWCRDCGRPAEDGKEHCMTCGSYWADVSNGLFEDPWEPIGEELRAALEQDNG